MVLKFDGQTRTLVIVGWSLLPQKYDTCTCLPPPSRQVQSRLATAHRAHGLDCSVQVLGLENKIQGLWASLKSGKILVKYGISKIWMENTFSVFIRIPETSVPYSVPFLDFSEKMKTDGSNVEKRTVQSEKNFVHFQSYPRVAAPSDCLLGPLAPPPTFHGHPMCNTQSTFETSRYNTCNIHLKTDETLEIYVRNTSKDT
jgi:hypothetical protein